MFCPNMLTCSLELGPALIGFEVGQEGMRGMINCRIWHRTSICHKDVFKRLVGTGIASDA